MMTKEIINPGRVINVDGRLYYRVRCQCPVCIERGYHPEMRFWKHGVCDGDMYLGGNAHFMCDKCGETDHIMNCGYSCPIHNISSKGEFIGRINSEYIGIPYPSTGPGFPSGDRDLEFLEEFVNNLRKSNK